MSQKYFVIEKLAQLQMTDYSDPFVYYVEFCKLLDAVKSLKIDTDIIAAHFIWNGLNNKFQNILVNMLNKTHPTLNDINTKYLEAANRYQSEVQSKVVSMATGLKTSVSKSKSNSKSYTCVLCDSSTHNIAKCTI